MKQKFIIITALVLLSTLSYAQVRTGIHIGTGYSDVFSKTDHDGRATFSAGFIGEYKLKSGLVWHGELNYVNKGATLHNPETQQWNGLIDKYKFSLHYIELPLSIGYAMPLAGNSFITPRAGIYGAYGICGYGHITTDNLKSDKGSGTMRVSPFKGTQGKMPAQDAQYYFDEFQRPDIGILLGLDIDFSKQIRLSASAQMNVLYPLVSYSDAGNVRFRSFNVALGYMF